MTQDEFVALLRKKQGKRTAREFAEELGISAAYLSDIYHGKRYAGPAVLDRLGLQRAVVYQEA